jgi:hypothetical protein
MLPETSSVESTDGGTDESTGSEQTQTKVQKALRDQEITLALASPEVADDVAVRLDITL